MTDEMRRMPSTDAEKLEFMELDIERKKSRLETLEKKLGTLLEFVRDKMKKPEMKSIEIQTEPVVFEQPKPKKSDKISKRKKEKPKVLAAVDKMDKGSKVSSWDDEMSELSEIETTSNKKPPKKNNY